MNIFLIFCVIVLLLSSLFSLLWGRTTLLKISTGSSISISSKVLSGRNLWHFITIIFSSFSVFSLPFLLLKTRSDPLSLCESDLQSEDCKLERLREGEQEVEEGRGRQLRRGWSVLVPGCPSSGSDWSDD